MRRTGTHIRKTSTGFEQTITTYAAQRCEGCLLRGVCHKGKGNRVIEVNHHLNRLKAIAKEKLQNEVGVKKQKQRCCDPEQVFGHIKNNHGFTRFLLRGKEKVAVETGLLALARNLRKKAASVAAKHPKSKKEAAEKGCLQPICGYCPVGRAAA